MLVSESSESSSESDDSDDDSDDFPVRHKQLAKYMKECYDWKLVHSGTVATRPACSPVANTGRTLTFADAKKAPKPQKGSPKESQGAPKKKLKDMTQEEQRLHNKKKIARWRKRAGPDKLRAANASPQKQMETNAWQGTVQGNDKRAESAQEKNETPFGVKRRNRKYA